jgi:hypothetical protein
MRYGPSHGRTQIASDIAHTTTPIDIIRVGIRKNIDGQLLLSRVLAAHPERWVLLVAASLLGIINGARPPFSVKPSFFLLLSAFAPRKQRCFRGAKADNGRRTADFQSRSVNDFEKPPPRKKTGRPTNRASLIKKGKISTLPRHPAFGRFLRTRRQAPPGSDSSQRLRLPDSGGSLCSMLPARTYFHGPRT